MMSLFQMLWAGLWVSSSFLVRVLLVVFVGSGSVDLQCFLLPQGHRTARPQIPRLWPAYTLWPHQQVQGKHSFRYLKTQFMIKTADVKSLFWGKPIKPLTLYIICSLSDGLDTASPNINKYVKCFIHAKILWHVFWMGHISNVSMKTHACQTALAVVSSSTNS